MSVYFSLAVRDLSSLVKPDDIISSEHLITLLAIVPKYSQKDWLASYETLASYVVRYVSFMLKIIHLVIASLRAIIREKIMSIVILESSSLVLHCQSLFHHDGFSASA